MLAEKCYARCARGHGEGEGRAFRGLYVTKLVTYRVYASILNGVYRTLARERLFEHAFCSLRSHGTRDKGWSIID